MKRLHHCYPHTEIDSDSPHWRILKEHVLKKTHLEPFGQIDDVLLQGFYYLNSKERTDRFQILEGDAPYKASTNWTADAAKFLWPGAGPVEIDVAGFILDPRPDLGVLIGGMGSGKSTTLRQISEHLKKSIQIRYINCDKKAIDPENPPPASELLVKVLKPLTVSLITPEKEFSEFWNWALEEYCSQNPGDRHSAATVLEPAVDALREKYGDQWQSSSAEAIAFRRQELHSRVCEKSTDKVDYIALLLDYCLTVTHKNERNHICIVLDNIDPLPPRLQRELLLQTSRFQLNAKCKVILAMRPLTYSLTHEQRGARTIRVIQHIGPPALDLIEDRVRRLIEQPDYPDLKMSIQSDGMAGRELQQQEFKGWVRQVISDIKTSRSPGHRSQNPSASEFIEGLCNNSLRSALIVAEKVFGSTNLPMALIKDSGSSEAPHTTILKNHAIIRAILLGKHAHFVSDINRVTDNIFDLGDATPNVSPTCKYRLLKELASAPGRGILPLTELCKRLRYFGYEDQTIIEAVNGIISQTKRLAWSDRVVAYKSLVDFSDSKLSISRAGRFYVDQAIYSLEYVQEVHVDVLLPETVHNRIYNHPGFVERIDSLYRFIRYLHDIDSKEVRRAMTDRDAVRLYRTTYGEWLFSSRVADAIAPQVINIGDSILRRRDERTQFEIEQALSKWRSLSALLENEDKDVIEALQKQGEI